ncbi:MAG TPA: hypothetical protein VFZ48_01080 [Candidatus Saccharimonadales bacterium]
MSKTMDGSYFTKRGEKIVKLQLRIAAKTGITCTIQLYTSSVRIENVSEHVNPKTGFITFTGTTPDSDGSRCVKVFIEKNDWENPILEIKPAEQ